MYEASQAIKASTTEGKMSDETQYLVIEGWSDHLHPDLTRKVKPPFRWIKLQTESLDSLGDLTPREFGAYCRLLMLAALTNNLTIFKPGWIKRRTGITQKDIEKLQKRCLISIRNQPPDSEKDQQNQENNLGTASGSPANRLQAAAPEGRGRDRNRYDLNGIEDSLTQKTESKKKNGRDSRSFEDLKAEVLPIALQFKTNNPDEIERLAGQSLNMSSRQIQAAVKQLVEDKQL